MEEITYFCKADKSQQPAMIRRAAGREPRPLLVGLHTWSADHTVGAAKYAEACEKLNWNLIYPNFRGPNWTPEACGSDYVVSDLEDAVAYMEGNCGVDVSRVYLCGGSGGGHCTLLMAGRRPDLWTAVSAWCPISDVAAWHAQCLDGRHRNYSENIEKACGGAPNAGMPAAREARLRSPLTWLRNAVGLTVDISTGIHDGYTGSVPVSQAILAFNELAAPEDRISDEDIETIVKTQAIPPHLGGAAEDPSFGEFAIHFRRQSRNVRLTLFEGGHDQLLMTALRWLERQKSGQATDWTPGCALPDVGNKSQLTW